MEPLNPDQREGLRYEGLSHRYTDQFAGLIKRFVADQGEPISYEGASWGSRETDLPEAGYKRAVPQERLEDDVQVAVSKLNPSGRKLMGEVLQSVFGQDAQPVGYFELSKGKYAHMNFTTTVYVLNIGEILTWTSWSIADDNALSDESKACYEFARDIGLGDTWVQAMFEADNEGKTSGESTSYMDLTSAKRLLSFLNTCLNEV